MKRAVLDPTLHGRKRYNITFFGDVGVGKSSMINGFVTVAGEPGKRKAPAIARQNEATVTTQVI